jgi:hypothetical protein
MPEDIEIFKVVPVHTLFKFVLIQGLTPFPH